MKNCSCCRIANGSNLVPVSSAIIFNMAAKNVIGDLLEYLRPDSREDVKFFAMNYVLGLTGSEEGMRFIEEHPELLEKVVTLTHADKMPRVKKDGYAFLLNASVSPVMAEKLHELNLYEELLIQLLDKSCIYADNLAMLLSNLTRMEGVSEKCLETIELSEGCSMKQIFEALCVGKYNVNGDLHYLATFLSNMSQLRKVRELVLDSNAGLIQRILPIIYFQESVIRRKGVVRIIRNCCFEYDFHAWLLGEDVDILPSLLLPLAGPEEFSETEMEKLPLDLQYLEESKQREADPEIRKMLVETITLLCSTKFGREYIKAKNTYLIIRELHNWETDDNVSNAIENLVQILIGDEPEPGLANLHEIEIPRDLREKFVQQDEAKSN